MDTNEYLVARIGTMQFGIYCRDVLNVYSRQIKLVRLFYQDHIFRGITRINGTVMQVIDLRRRIGMGEASTGKNLTVISFQTEMQKTVAVVVDEIVGMRSIPIDLPVQNNANLNNTERNVNLLFPMIAVMPDGELIHILDSTYLDKTEPVAEEAGDLELF